MATRDQLKKEFKSGECPSQEDYYAIFDSTIGYDEDGVTKPSGNNPLKIQGRGTEENILRFTPRNISLKEWLIQLNKENKPGLSISNKNGPCLFIKEDGKIGIGTDDPNGTLHILRNDLSSHQYSPLVATFGRKEPHSRSTTIKIQGSRSDAHGIAVASIEFADYDYTTGKEFILSKIVSGRPMGEHNQETGFLAFLTNSGDGEKEQVRITKEGNLIVNGTIESTTSGVQFPDGTTQNSSANKGRLRMPFIPTRFREDGVDFICGGEGAGQLTYGAPTDAKWLAGIMAIPIPIGVTKLQTITIIGKRNTPGHTEVVLYYSQGMDNYIIPTSDEEFEVTWWVGANIESRAASVAIVKAPTNEDNPILEISEVIFEFDNN